MNLKSLIEGSGIPTHFAIVVWMRYDDSSVGTVTCRGLDLYIADSHLYHIDRGRYLFIKNFLPS